MVKSFLNKDSIIVLALLFIIVEGLASIVYHAPNDPDLLSITNLGRYARVLAAMLVLFLMKRSR